MFVRRKQFSLWKQRTKNKYKWNSVAHCRCANDQVSCSLAVHYFLTCSFILERFTVVVVTAFSCLYFFHHPLRSSWSFFLIAVCMRNIRGDIFEHCVGVVFVGVCVCIYDYLSENTLTSYRFQFNFSCCCLLADRTMPLPMPCHTYALQTHTHTQPCWLLASSNVHKRGTVIIGFQWI